MTFLEPHRAAAANHTSKKRLRIAWFSPFPPQRSGIANYSYWLIKELRSSFDIDLYYDGDPPVAELADSFASFPLSTFAERNHLYDRAVYHLGNNHEFHTGIYKMAWNLPDIIVLHDYDLSGFMHEAFLRSNPDLFFRALPNGSPLSAFGALDLLKRKLLSRGRSDPMSHAIVNRSKRVIVHHQWVKQQFGDNRHMQVIPHFAKLNYAPAGIEIKSFKTKLGIRDDHFVLTCLGFLNPNKLPQLQIDVVKRLLKDGYPIQLIFAGEPSPEVKSLVDEVRAGEFPQNILFTGYQTELDYFCAIKVADVIINLRNPSMGEASGTLMHALAAAKPAIISDANQYREFPDKVCWKLPHDETEHEVLFEYLKTLLSEPAVRREISANAAEYVKNVLALEQVRNHWVRALSSE